MHETNPGATAPPVSVLVASHSELLQAGLVTLIRQMPELRLRGTASDAHATAKSLLAYRPAVLLVEHDMYEDVRVHYKGGHRPRLLLFSSRNHAGAPPACSSDCACGFIRFTATLRHIRAALRTVASCNTARRGDSYCSSCPLQGSMQPPALPLSRRELEVFERIGRGESNQQIALSLDRSVKTVETHRENIKRKLGIATAAALTEAAIAWRRGDALPKGTGTPAPRGDTHGRRR